MAVILATDRDGGVHRIEAETDLSVMQNLKDVGGLDVAAICGGCCSCATCHVYVEEAWLGRLEPQDASERELVEDSQHYRPNSRLSCQIPFSADLDGLALTLAPEE